MLCQSVVVAVEDDFAASKVLTDSGVAGRDYGGAIFDSSDSIPGSLPA